MITMQIRQLDRGNLTRKYEIDAQLLLPWGGLNAPFRGAWCIVRKGTDTTPHSHAENEIFIAMTGSAELVVDTERRPFVPGDIAHLPPWSTHHVSNSGTEDFEYYAIWWDKDMSVEFAARDEPEHGGE